MHVSKTVFYSFDADVSESGCALLGFFKMDSDWACYILVTSSTPVLMILVLGAPFVFPNISKTT